MITIFAPCIRSPLFAFKDFSNFLFLLQAIFVGDSSFKMQFLGFSQSLALGFESFPKDFIAVSFDDQAHFDTTPKFFTKVY
jgi:hypothetical protein